jgi:hypothetical protein
MGGMHRMEETPHPVQNEPLDEVDLIEVPPVFQGKKRYSSEEYNMKAEAMMLQIQRQMITDYGLQEVWMPEQEKESLPHLPKCNIFMSKEFLKPSKEQVEANALKVGLVLIQGTGAVRAGVWARSVCINETNDLGSMLPQIRWATERGHPVIVLNPNYNHHPFSGQPIKGSESMSEHAKSVWKHFIEPSGIGRLLIIAHSAGGGCVTEIQQSFPESFYSKVVQLAYTDSWVISEYALSLHQKAFMKERAVHYVASQS